MSGAYYKLSAERSECVSNLKIHKLLSFSNRANYRYCSMGGELVYERNEDNGRKLILVHNEKKTDISSCPPVGRVSTEAKRLLKWVCLENYLKSLKSF